MDTTPTRSDQERDRSNKLVTKKEFDDLKARLNQLLIYDLDQIVQIKNVLGIDDPHPRLHNTPKSKTIDDILKRLEKLESKIDKD